MSLDTEIRLVITDDHPIVREGLSSLIQRHRDMQVVGEAGNGIEALELYREQRPDVLLMDLRMPVMDGITATREIRREFPGARIILLTTFDNDEYVYRGLQAGARAYLLKDMSQHLLLETIRIVHAGQVYIPAGIAEKLKSRLTLRELTSREQEVLEEMAEGRSNQEIALKLFVTESTVKSHVNSILSKLRVSDRTKAVTKAIKLGMVLL